jgi:hypothetical protein
MLHDEAVYANALEFIPERYINADSEHFAMISKIRAKLHLDLVVGEPYAQRPQPESGNMYFSINYNF